MRRLWEESLLRGGKAGEAALLSSSGALLLWEQALSQHAIAGFDLEQNASLARQSWNLALEYGINLERLRAEVAGEDERRFARWVARFEELRKSGDWQEPAALPGVLLDDIHTGAISVAGRVFLVGIDGPQTPPLAALLAALGDAGADLATLSRTPRAAWARQIEYATGDEELRAAALWAGDRNSGVILLDFHARADRARRALLDRMQPAWQARGFPQDAPLNSAEAPTLSHAGPAEMALDALNLLPTGIDFETVSRVLRGAYLRGSYQEAGERARLERSIREQLVGGDITRAQLMARAGRATPILAEILQNSWKAARQARGKGKAHSFRTWAQVFTTFLRELGWPGARPLVSSEQQAVEALTRLLSEFGGCDAIHSWPVSLAAGLSRLTTMVRERKFQPQGPDESVELLTIEEVAGMHFDRLWIAGARANLWPGAIRPTPLLPLGLQRRLKMPQASPQATLAQARRQTESLLHAAEEVVFSWTGVAEEGVSTTCSPLISKLPVLDKESIVKEADSPAYAESLRLSARLEVLGDDPPPPLTHDEKISGGTRLIDQQLKCPFRAFAEYRLHAREYPRPWGGLSPLQRGDMVHKLLYRLYSEFGDSKSLKNALPRLPDLLAEWSVEIPRDDPPGLRALVLGLLRLERERTVQLVLEWVLEDLKRGSFNVEQLERRAELPLGAITLVLRLDRIDRPPAGGPALVLDYKTGVKLPLGGLNPERLRFAQLPAYALAAPNVAGVAYVHLSGEESSVAGVYDPAAAIPGMEELPRMVPISEHKDFKIYPQWQYLLQAWREALEDAARDLSGGDARMEIFSSDDSARRQYQVFSRIHELERDSSTGHGDKPERP